MAGKKKTGAAGSPARKGRKQPLDAPDEAPRAGRIDPSEQVKDDVASPAAAGAAAFAELERRVWQTVSGNLHALIDASGLSQREFSEITGIAPATLSGYLKDDSEHFKIPPVSYIVNLCRHERFRGFNLDVGDFINRRLTFVSGAGAVDDSIPGRDSYTGCYYSYFYKFPNAGPQATPDLTRKLRLGVILVFDDPGSRDEPGRLGVMARFFDSDSHRDEARALKDKITSMLRDHSMTEVRSLMRTASGESECYTGSMTFADKHFFLSLECRALGDHALMIFNLPTKPPYKTYIGGLGCVNSISRGNQRLPVAQRVILTRCSLDCPDSAIARELRLATVPLRLDQEGTDLVELIRSMYDTSPGNVFNTIPNSDRMAIVSHRLANLVEQYIDRNSLSVFCVTTDDNYTIYRFILENLSRSDPVFAELFGEETGGSLPGELRLPEEESGSGSGPVIYV